MATFKKLFSRNILRRNLQTVQNIEPLPGNSGYLQGLTVDSVPIPTITGRDGPHFRPSHKSSTVAEILHDVKATEGLPQSPCHIEHIIGRATKGKIYQKHILHEASAIGSPLHGENSYNFPMDFTKTQEKYEVGGIDIAEKTQLILQSPHPVRYVIERELYKSQQGFHLRLPTYHTWLMLFGRSLYPQFSSDRNSEKQDILIDNIANASDSGMFSSDIHNTIIDIADNHPSFQNCSSQFHMGNKYAVLVGDYFAIRCIHYAEKTKTNSVMVAITEGVEEYTTSSFGTTFFDKNAGFPMLLSPGATPHDWIQYNQKAFGYFKGGLYAAISIQQRNLKFANVNPSIGKFVDTFSLFLKACSEIEAFEQTDNMVVPSPFLLTSLPAVLCQLENPAVFERLRALKFELNMDQLREVHAIIRKDSLSMKRSKNVILGLASNTKQALRHIASNVYYINVLDSLIDSIANGD